MYGYSHAIVSTLLGSSVAWISSGAKHAGISRAFQQATLALGLYVGVNLILVAVALREGLLHLFNYNYYSVQLWLFYNLTLSGVLLWQMYRSMERAREVRGNERHPRSLFIYGVATKNRRSVRFLANWSICLYSVSVDVFAQVIIRKCC